MKKKHKKIMKQLLNDYLEHINEHEVEEIPNDIKLETNSMLPPVSFEDLDFQIISEQDTGEIIIKIGGFNTLNNSVQYAQYLAKYLPLMLYKSTVIH